MKGKVLGYCWEWKSEGKENTNVHNIVLDDFSMRRNLANSKIWAMDENSVNELGCIHTSQNLEFDYVAVMICEDIRFG